MISINFSETFASLAISNYLGVWALLVMTSMDCCFSFWWNHREWSLWFASFVLLVTIFFDYYHRVALFGERFWNNSCLVVSLQCCWSPLFHSIPLFWFHHVAVGIHSFWSFIVSLLSWANWWSLPIYQPILPHSYPFSLLMFSSNEVNWLWFLLLAPRTTGWWFRHLIQNSVIPLFRWNSLSSIWKAMKLLMFSWSYCSFKHIIWWSNLGFCCISSCQLRCSRPVLQVSILRSIVVFMPSTFSWGLSSSNFVCCSLTGSLSALILSHFLWVGQKLSNSFSKVYGVRSLQTSWCKMSSWLFWADRLTHHEF